MSVLKYRRQEVLVGKLMHMYVGSLWSLSSFPMTKYNSANKGASPSCFQCYSTSMKRGNELAKLLGTKTTLKYCTTDSYYMTKNITFLEWLIHQTGLILSQSIMLKKIYPVKEKDMMLTIRILFFVVCIYIQHLKRPEVFKFCVQEFLKPSLSASHQIMPFTV